MKLSLPLKNIKPLKYPWGPIYQNFGENPKLYWRFGLNGHNGIDFVTYENDEVLAVCDGTVLKCDYNEKGFGYGVWMLSNPYIGEDGQERALLITYFHLNTFKIGVGQKVKQGDILGLEGNTGFVVSGNTPYWGN